MPIRFGCKAMYDGYTCIILVKWSSRVCSRGNLDSKLLTNSSLRLVIRFTLPNNVVISVELRGMPWSSTKAANDEHTAFNRSRSWIYCCSSETITWARESSNESLTGVGKSVSSFAGNGGNFLSGGRTTVMVFPVWFSSSVFFSISLISWPSFPRDKNHRLCE
ncbi:hypothetical protein OGAPHI_003832 [Ogataea philodendri]|uniref:Uncharacterized protein n=1 Tax=Ogataea philodendri TaxID=1378263 RepID=A0A9P8T4V5_9ASCO|nr:uncharacterized protein OGAPHI_003832 [Ogataea philodendri]KAH3665644.1 hypothetical protein OGAPHI_003832 [Ogataea philodendri]